MKNLSLLIFKYVKHLKKFSIANAQRIVEEMVSFVTKIPRDLLFFTQKEVSTEQIQIIENYLKKILEGTPIEYIIQEVDFARCKICVNPCVLIPRPETEIMIDKFITYVKNKEHKGKVLFDICTGSGCLGIAAKKNLPNLQVYLSDISSKALSVAKKNAQANSVDLEILQGDLFAPYGQIKADFILCNPPYLTTQEYIESMNKVEPKIALLSGDKGIEFYEKIAEDLLKYVNPGAVIFLEIGYQMKEKIENIFHILPHRLMEVTKDWSGLNRFFFLEME